MTDETDTTETTIIAKPARATVTVAFWAQLGTNIAALLLALVIIFQASIKYDKATIAQAVQNQSVVQHVETDVSIHAKAEAARSCSQVRLLVFIIEKGYQRSERLGVSNGEPPYIRKRLGGFERDACTYVAPVAEP